MIENTENDILDNLARNTHSGDDSWNKTGQYIEQKLQKYCSVKSNHPLILLIFRKSPSPHNVNPTSNGISDSVICDMLV